MENSAETEPTDPLAANVLAFIRDELGIELADWQRGLVVEYYSQRAEPLDFGPEHVIGLHLPGVGWVPRAYR